jgi:hypothetical protein
MTPEIVDTVTTSAINTTTQTIVTQIILPVVHQLPESLDEGLPVGCEQLFETKLV